MLDKLKRSLFWDQSYEREWKYPGADNLTRLVFGFVSPRDSRRWDRTIEGAKLKWKDRGRAVGMSPRMARFRALEEIADFFYDEVYQPASGAEPTNAENVLKEMGRELWRYAPWEGGVSAETHISARWKPYVSAHRDAMAASNQQKAGV